MPPAAHETFGFALPSGLIKIGNQFTIRHYGRDSVDEFLIWGKNPGSASLTGYWQNSVAAIFLTETAFTLQQLEFYSDLFIDLFFVFDFFLNVPVHIIV